MRHTERRPYTEVVRYTKAMRHTEIQRHTELIGSAGPIPSGLPKERSCVFTITEMRGFELSSEGKPSAELPESGPGFAASGDPKPSSSFSDPSPSAVATASFSPVPQAGSDGVVEGLFPTVGVGAGKSGGSSVWMIAGVGGGVFLLLLLLLALWLWCRKGENVVGAEEESIPPEMAIGQDRLGMEAEQVPAWEPGVDEKSDKSSQHSSRQVSGRRRVRW
jgi:hypothetical protein